MKKTTQTVSDIARSIRAISLFGAAYKVETGRYGEALATLREFAQVCRDERGYYAKLAAMRVDALQHRLAA